MTWLLNAERGQSELAARFRANVQQTGILKVPGVHDAMTALIAKETGFEVLYLSGAAYAASRGLPDVGMLASEEVARRARDIIRATQLPLIVDIDTGYGGLFNVARAAREMTEVHVAAVQIEDQDLPKKCGHLMGKSLITAEEMIQKIRVIKDVSPNLVVVARTDAYGVEGMDMAVERAKRYADAGADVIFPEALVTKDDFTRMVDSVQAPLLANITEFGQTPLYRSEELEKWGYKIVIYPVTSLRVAARACEEVFSEILHQGTQQASVGKMQTRAQLYETIEYKGYEEFLAKYRDS